MRMPTRGSRIWTEVSLLLLPLPSVPRALSFPFSPAPARFNSPLPIPPYERKRPLRRREFSEYNVNSGTLEPEKYEEKLHGAHSG